MNDSIDNTTTVMDDLCPHTGVISWYSCVFELYAPTALFVDKYISPVLYFIGLFGNILTIKIWSRRIRKTNTSALYLTVLALSDLFMLCLHSVMELQFTWGVSTLNKPTWCPVFFVFYMFAQYMSPLLIMGFTLERFISIAIPFKGERFSRRNRGALEIIVIILVSILLAVPQIFGWTVLPDGECQGTGSNFFETWIWVSDILVFCVFPVVSLVLNILVINAVSRSIKLRRDTAPTYEMNGFSSKLLKTKSKDNNRVRLRISTVTLLCVSFYRIFTVIPVAIIFALQYRIPPGDQTLSVSEIGTDSTWRAFFDYFTAKKIIDEIGLSQYSCNVFLYYMTANYFRNEVCRLFQSLTECRVRNSDARGRKSGTEISTKGTVVSLRKSFYD
ncbi:rhodopsin, GQ-coupled-like [Saccostrea echinata]|uniref:rhodopsin, GQ-coupled-like n=1 Tax=Saccostrea echinata TaxID=191078 RepID=UPI002A83A496|nr:rhodopsin, GQ-coupled-like [Saccostrea echinata]